MEDVVWGKNRGRKYAKSKKQLKKINKNKFFGAQFPYAAAVERTNRNRHVTKKHNIPFRHYVVLTDGLVPVSFDPLTIHVFFGYLKHLAVRIIYSPTFSQILIYYVVLSPHKFLHPISPSQEENFENSFLISRLYCKNN